MVDTVVVEPFGSVNEDVGIESSTMLVPDEVVAMTPKHELKENLAADESLRDGSMSCAALSAMSFEQIESPAAMTGLKITVPMGLRDPVPISSASSTCTRESDAGALSDVEVVIAHHGTGSGSHKAVSPPPSRLLHRIVSEKLNAKYSARKTSRQGRSTQRWVTENNENIRLVTGAVPILRGGKILFVSSRRKPEWIIPKGGWEKDEAMEESAIRECFEEAGVFGVLGPKLSEVQYETRKAKKRRLEMESAEREVKSEISESKSKTDEVDSDNMDEKPSTPEPATLLSPQDMARIREQVESTQDKSGDDKTSVGSATHSQVRMSLYPLYVHKVLEEWPESGRFRKAVDIDTAIEMLGNRPELQAVLQEVKDRGLHQLSAPGSNETI